jgi:DNA-directed RNA polymerase subunit RPC12/RpoP
MSTGKIIGYIAAGILVFFGVLFLWAAFSDEATNPGGRLLVGGLSVLIGLGIIVAVRLREPKPKQEVTIRQQIELAGDVEMETLKCRNCGSQLDKNAISTAQGAIVVSCPYCGTTYQLTEEPKW